MIYKNYLFDIRTMLRCQKRSYICCAVLNETRTFAEQGLTERASLKASLTLIRFYLGNDLDVRKHFHPQSYLLLVVQICGSSVNFDSWWIPVATPLFHGKLWHFAQY